MIKFLEMIIDQYYIFRDYLLWGMGVFFLCVIIGGLYYFKENRRYIINKLLHNFSFTIIFIVIGELLYFLGVTAPTEYVYFNAVIFVFGMGIIIFNGIVQMVMYRKIVTPMVQLSKYIQYLLFFELFLLAATYRLEIIEWLVGMFAVLSCQLIITMVGKLDTKEKLILKESDYPNPHLYYTREKQLEKFISILEQQKGEPYAVMISGEWGLGKTSFVQALEKRLKELNNDYFVWIYAGSEKSVSDIMLDVAGQILEILKENNIYIENSDLIEKYFVAFSGLLEENGLKFFNKVSNLFGITKQDTSKEYINGKLSELSKLNRTIYLIIDDLDRCDKDYQIKMFKVIRESTELVNCKTIFLVDQKVFLDNEYNANYIEKYISYTLDLCKVDCRELLDYYMEEIFSSSFFDTLDGVLLKNRNAIEIKSMIGEYPQNVIETFKSEIVKIKEEFESKSEKAKSIEKEHVKFKIEDLENTMNVIEKNISNSRKVKNYLKGVKRDISNLNVEIDRCTGEFKSEDWIKGIIEVQFVKNILPEVFTEVKMCESIEEFGGKYSGYSLDIIWGIYLGLWFHSEKKEAILNNIIYNLDVIDFLHIKTQREKYLDELYSSKANIKNINQYVEYAQSYRDLNKIIEVCEAKYFDGDADKEKFLVKILECLSNQSSPFKTNEEGFLSFSKRLIEWAAKSGLSERGKRICTQAGYNIVRRCIIDNSLQFRKILSIFFPVTKIEETWHSLAVSYIDEFFTELKKIDKDFLFKGLEDETNKLSSIKNYYGNLETELQKEEYKKVGIDTKKIFMNINFLFEVCQLWNEVENAINLKQDNEIAEFNQYFEVNGYSIKSSTFSNIDNLLYALQVLKKYYEKKEGCYESDYSLFLLRLSYKIVLKIESEPEWFGDKRKEVEVALTEISEVVNILDKTPDRYTKDTIDLINIYTYRYKLYCGQSKQA